MLQECPENTIVNACDDVKAFPLLSYPLLLIFIALTIEMVCKMLRLMLIPSL